MPNELESMWMGMSVWSKYGIQVLTAAMGVSPQGTVWWAQNSVDEF